MKNENVMTISLNGIVPKYSGKFCLSINLLKSFLLSRSQDYHITTDVHFCEDTVDSIVSKIMSKNADVIAFSAYIWNVEIIKKVAKSIKEKKKKSFIIVGGPEVYFDTQKILEENPGFDLIVKGEGEEVIYEIMERIRQKNQNFRDVSAVTFRENNEIIDNTPTFNFQLEEQDYAFNVDELSETEYFFYESSRGCPFTCRYCGWSLRSKQKIREYPMNKIKNDLEQIFRLPKLKFLTLTDSNLLLRKKRALNIFKLFNKLNTWRGRNGLPVVSFQLATRPEDLEDEIIKEMLQFPANNSTMPLYGFGLQSIVPETLETLGRKLDLKKFEKGIKKAKEMGLKNTLVDIIHGLPGDTLENYRKTLDYVISDLNVENFCSYHYHVIPHTYFGRHTEDYGLKFEPTPPYRLISSNTFSEEDLKKANRTAFFLGIIYSSIPRIRKEVDRKFSKNKLPVYEKIIDHIEDKYNDHFHLDSDQRYLLADIRNIRKSENYELRKSIIHDARNIISAAAETRIN